MTILHARHSNEIPSLDVRVPKSNPNSLYADELSALLDSASSVRVEAGVANRIDILAIDIVRDVLLNCGGLGHAGSICTYKEQCKKSLGRLFRRRARVPMSLIAAPEVADLKIAFLARVDEQMALLLHEGLHYLGIPRAHGLHLGLFTLQPGQAQARLLGLSSIHSFDLNHLVPRVISKFDASHARVLSRLLVLPGAPRNTLSRLLGEVFSWLRRQDEGAKLLITYNNPNIGFLGSIYRATNWSLAGTDHKLADMQLDEDYISLRELKLRFGTYCYNELKDQLGPRLRILPEPLQPLQIYVHSIKQQKPRYSNQ